VADAIGRGLARRAEVAVVPVDRADAAAVAQADLVVVGGPTHAHGMTRASTRKAAVDQLEKSGTLVLDPDATGLGLRDWFEALGRVGGMAAAFDTRAAAAPPALTGRASRGIAKRLRGHGWRMVEEPESFLVDKENHLTPGEVARAEQWGAQLVETSLRSTG
jgi:hypothetical protein